MIGYYTQYMIKDYNMKNLNSAKELDAMAQDTNIPESVEELELLASNIRSQIRIKMIEELQAGTRVVTFTKVNGEQREMTCTLDPNLIPDPIETKANKSPKAVNEEVLPVWDTTAQGWRAFRIDNVTSFT